MQYRTLGSTGIETSVIGLGTWQFGGEWGQDFTPSEVDTILGTALEEGINLIDTAECYGDHLSEELIGHRLRGRPSERDRWIIATKFGHRYYGFQDRTRHWTAGEMRAQLERSLRALRTDRVDILQFHSPNDDEFVNEELWAELVRVREAGMVRFVGLSAAKDTDNLFQVERSPAAGCEVLQIVYNRLERAPEQAVLTTAQRLNLGVLARVPLASGFLSGKYNQKTRFAENDWRSTMDAAKRDAMLQEVEAIRTGELPPDAPMVEWALTWPLRHPAVTAVIPGCRSAEQVKSNARAVRWIE